MKLPRWLSPVRTVEAETGWPPELCRRLAYSRLAQRAGVVADWIMFAGYIWMAAMGLLAVHTVITGFAQWQYTERLPAAVRIAIGVTLGSFMWGLPVAMSIEVRNRARKYMAAPWCFKCKYPIPPPREGRSYSICPECGEPIPPEIAGLVAQRGP